MTETQERPEMEQRATKRDLVEGNVDKVMDRNKALDIGVGGSAGIDYKNLQSIIETAKIMAMSGPAVPQWLQGNVGGCWAVIVQAIEWKMSPLSVARMSFEVKGVVSYMSQLVHAVIEARAPIKTRLICEYIGEGPTRQCIVKGTFIGEDIERVYTSPKFADINPKNSPLWVNDPDQQLWYFASRAWARRFAPDVLMGIYSKDELIDNPAIAEAGDRARPVGSGLALRLVEGSVDRTEGHRDGHVDSQLSELETSHTIITASTADGGPPVEASIVTQDDAANKLAETKPEKTTRMRKPRIVKPKNATEWVKYCREWLDASADATAIKKRWADEMALRNTCGVTTDERAPLQAAMEEKCKALGG
jgi:RecT family